MIDTEALRKKVIELAIQGKLTEQLPSDGDAETLYAQIQAQKSHLIKEGMIKKDKALPDIAAAEIPFEIPKNWKWVRAGSVLRVINGTSYDKGDVSDKGIRILRGGNIQYSKVFYFKDDVFISESYEDEEKKVKENDVLIVASTGSSTGIGKSGVVESTDDNTQIGAFLRIIRAHSPYISKYIDVYFMSDLYRSKIRDLAKGMNINNIKESYITEMLLPLPPLEEQKRIVKRLNDAFEYIGSIENLQAKYSNDIAVLKSKIIDAGIRGKLTEQLPEDGNAEDLYAQILNQKSQLIKEGKIKKEKPLPDITADEIPFEIPKNWKWVRLASVYEINPRVEADAETMAAFIPMEKISQGYLRDFTYDEQKWSIASKNHTKFQDDDVAFAKISPCFENRKSFIAKELPNGIGGGTTELIILRQKAILPEYTYYLITSQRFIDAGSMSYKGIVGQQRIKSDVVNSFLVPLPPYAEQKRIVEKIEAIMEQLN